jgi:hypothetical protein
MPSYNLSTRGRVADIVAGLRVDKAATAIAGATTKDLFTVSGGNCIIVGLIGEVTTIVQAQLDNAKYISTPTTGTAVDMCAVVDITGHEVGGLLTITGTLATAAVKGNAGAGVMMTNPILVAPGVIGINTSANNTGAYKFSIWYVPAEDGAYITAA